MLELAAAVVGTWLSFLFPAIAVDTPGLGFKNAAADLHGNFWRIFWTVTVAVLPLWLASIGIAIGARQFFASQYALWLVLTPLNAIIAASCYVLLVVIASRFYLLLGQRLTQPA